MSNYFNPYENFPRNHFAITPSDSATFAECLIYAGSDGTIALADDNGRVLTYTVKAGAILPIICSKVMATGTTVTPVYGLR